LNLNIVRPAGFENYNEPLPIMLWLYGGGFAQGSASDPMWNLTYIVDQSVRQNQPVIGVSINYRLSFLGFPGGAAALEQGINNLGLRDQRAAFAWVQENIAAFGGDPSKVTLWGESAGAVSIAYQLIAYGGEGGADLFRGGIMASGFFTGSTITTVNQTQPMFDKIVANANCTSSNSSAVIACLRAAPLSAIYPFEDDGPSFTPIVDGEFIRRSPSYEADDGNVARVPVLMGSNSDEGLLS
jgi:carboxylesterase type B